jgi:hypothetical protein
VYGGKSAQLYSSCRGQRTETAGAMLMISKLSTTAIGTEQQRLSYSLPSNVSSQLGAKLQHRAQASSTNHIPWIDSPLCFRAVRGSSHARLRRLQHAQTHLNTHHSLPAPPPITKRSTNRHAWMLIYLSGPLGIRYSSCHSGCPVHLRTESPRRARYGMNK